MPFNSRLSRDLGRCCALLAALIAAHSSARAAKICIDPGHGGSDPGAVGCGLKESAVVLDVGLKLRDLLKKVNLQVIMTRTTDTFVSLSGRTAYANSNGAHRFVSLHCNAASVVATGIETYCITGATSSSNGYKLASTIQQQMLAAWPLASRGVKKAGFYVLKYTSMPATLTEMGFINNCAKDAKYQGSTAHRLTAAKAHLFALQKHLGLPVVDPDKQTPTTGTLRGVVFEDKGKGTADMSTRILGAKVSLVGQGKAATSKSPDGAWSFSLAGGSYTVDCDKNPENLSVTLALPHGRR